MSSTTGYQTAKRLNNAQNESTFEINTSELPIIFKKGLFSKTLDPPNINKDEPRTIIVKCSHKGCL